MIFFGQFVYKKRFFSTMRDILHKELRKELAIRPIYDLAKNRYNIDSGQARGTIRKRGAGQSDYEFS